MRTWFAPVSMLVIAAVPMLLLPTPGSLDVRFYYSGAEASAFLNGLSATQAHTYLLHEWWDLLFLTAYSWLLVKLLRTPWAVVPGVLDLVETTVIIGALLGIPGVPLAPLGVVTALKWSSLPLVVLLKRSSLASKARPSDIR